MHTSGPWIVSPHAKNLVVTADDKIGIADVAMCAPWIKKPPQEEQDANVKLMAASPDLLKALEALYKIHQAHPDDLFFAYDFELASEAIKKARG